MDIYAEAMKQVMQGLEQARKAGVVVGPVLNFRAVPQKISRK